MERRCRHCRSPLPITARRHAAYCGASCRAKASRRRRREHPVPEELRRRARWVRYTAAKVPLTPHGKAASVIDPSTWSRFAEVESSTVGRGYGFVLDGDGIVCLDLDGCLSGGELAPWAREILDACPGTYVEVSPSGTGLHVFGFGQVERGRRVRRGGRAVEVYGRGRYIAVTGERFADTPRRLAALPDVGELV